MPIDSKAVGSNERYINIIGDPTTASNLASVLSVADSQSLTGLFAQLVNAVPKLLNAGGTYDRQRATAGATGVAAVNTEGTKATYSTSSLGVTLAATATDFWTLVGSGTKTIRLTRIAVSGIATSATTVEVQLIKRTSANSAGTATQPGIMQHDSNDAAPTAVANLYSANPTTGTSGGAGRGQKLNLGATGAAGQIVWDFTTRNSEGLVLRGTAQLAALNFNGAAVPSGTNLAIEAEWTEE